MDKDNPPFWRLGNPMFWGIGATLLVVFIASWMAFLPVCSLDPNGAETCQAKWTYLLGAPPNEVGDTLSGFAGVLAFVWIIVTVAMQSEELRAQREELQLTREEIKGQRSATEEMARSSKVQAEIFEKEQKQREQEAYRNIVEQKLVGIWYRMTTMPLSSVYWSIPESCFEDMEYTDSVDLFTLPETDDIHRLEMPETAAERDFKLRLQAYNLRELVGTLDQCASFRTKEQLPEKPLELDDLLDEIRRVMELEELLSEAARERLRNIMLNETYIELQKVSERSDLWSLAGHSNR